MSVWSASLIRIFNISNGKQKKSYKGSKGLDGSLLKVWCPLSCSVCMCASNTPEVDKSMGVCCISLSLSVCMCDSNTHEVESMCVCVDVCMCVCVCVHVCVC